MSINFDIGIGNFDRNKISSKKNSRRSSKVEKKSIDTNLVSLNPVWHNKEVSVIRMNFFLPRMKIPSWRPKTLNLGKKTDKLTNKNAYIVSVLKIKLKC